MSKSLQLGEVSRDRRMLILAICSLSLLIVGIDNTIVNVALPAIAKDLHIKVSGLQWIVDAYTLVLASLLLASGSIADRIGRRKIFQTGLLLFSLGSLACSVAPNLGMLIVFRMLQAVGGSMLNPVALSIITNTFTDPKERAQAIGVWGAVMGISLALGPVVGGVLVSSIGWRSIFWINIPIGVAGMILAGLFIPESRAQHPRRVDPIGQVLVFVLLLSLTYGIIEGPGSGWSSPKILAVFAVSIACLVSLILFESRQFEPLIDLRYFTSAPFAGATIMAAGAFASLGGFLFINTLYLQEDRGLSALHAGLDTLPMALMTVICAPLAGWIVGNFGTPRYPLVIGGVALAVASLWLHQLSVTTSFFHLFVGYSIFGVGFGLVNAPITNTAVSGMPRAQAGVAGGIAATSRQVGQSLGVAVVGALLSSALVVGHQTHIGQASHSSWWILFGFGVVIFALGFASTSSWAKQTTNRTVALLEAPDV